MLNHGTIKIIICPNIFLKKILMKIYISNKSRNKIDKLFNDLFWGFVIVASWTFVIKNLSNDEQTKVKHNFKFM